MSEDSETLPLLLAAASAGVHIPSDTLTAMGVDLNDDSWQALNRFQAALPVHLTQDADGAPIAWGSLKGTWVEEDDEELVLDD